LKSGNTAKAEGKGTKEAILDSAIELFSQKGYTETSMREIAVLAGIKPGSIYNHYASKQEILERMLDIYEASTVSSSFYNFDRLDRLAQSPSVDRIMECLVTRFEKKDMPRARNILYIILHEQYRNDIVREYVRERFMVRNEEYIRSILDRLMDAGAIEPLDSVAVAKVQVATQYYWACASLMGLDDSPAFLQGHSMDGIMRAVFESFVRFRAESAAPEGGGG